MKLHRDYVEKPWGRTSLPAMFDGCGDKRIGEVWFTGAKGLPLLAKYIFTSEALSIQVHPNDEQARARGLPSGKSECWYIVDAEPGAVLGLGLRETVTAQELRDAALSGTIEQLIAWKPVQPGDFISVPAGTIHAIGAGITLLEFQQNVDVTYRLYDYGRPRELHLDDGIAVAARDTIDGAQLQHVQSGEQRLLLGSGPFSLACGSNDDAFGDRQRWVIPITGSVRADDDVAHAGDVLLVGPGQPVAYEGAWALTGVSNP